MSQVQHSGRVRTKIYACELSLCTADCPVTHSARVTACSCEGNKEQSSSGRCSTNQCSQSSAVVLLTATLKAVVNKNNDCMSIPMYFHVCGDSYVSFTRICKRILCLYVSLKYDKWKVICHVDKFKKSIKEHIQSVSLLYYRTCQ